MIGTIHMNVDSLMRQYGEKVYNIAYHILFDHHRAEDAVQETFLNVHNNLEKFRGESGVYTWIYRIAVNCALKLAKKENKVIQESMNETIERDHQPIPTDLLPELQSEEGKFIIDDLVNDIRQKCHLFVTHRLSEERRVVFILRHVFHFSYQEIATILEISENVVKVRLNRARDQLKAHYKDKCYWHNKNNSCKCANKLGFVLAKYPQIIDEVKKRMPDSSFKKQLHESLKHRDLSIETIYEQFPMIKYQAKSIPSSQK